MQLTITSGKGGTGKTLVATNLAHLLSVEQDKVIQLLDCDVEAPNDHLFFDQQIQQEIPVFLQIPEIDHERCTLCNHCADVCEFNAIAVFGKSVLVFPELCHACGGCTLACPEQAIHETEHQTGTVAIGESGALQLYSGLLNIGEAKSPPVIQAVKYGITQDRINILDSPPGTSCPVVETLHGADYVVMVAEDSPFGCHDLKLAVKLVSAMNLPKGLVINKADPSFPDLRRFAEQEQIPVLAEIPFDRNIAEIYSRGELLVEQDEKYHQIFTQLWTEIKKNI